MVRKPGLTLQQHIELGGELAALRDALLKRSVAVSNAYPRTARQGHELEKAVNALDTARSLLDSALATDSPDAFEPGIYYPGDGRIAIVFEEAAGLEADV